MTSHSQTGLSRRRLVQLAAGAGVAGMLPLARPAIAQAKPIKVGLLLPYSGTYAQLGEAITRAMELYVKQNQRRSALPCQPQPVAAAMRRLHAVSLNREKTRQRSGERDIAVNQQDERPVCSFWQCVQEGARVDSPHRRRDPSPIPG